MMKRVIVIGSGFAGMAAAACLAAEGAEVTVLEKNHEPGGRARVWKQEGFTFDLGPSWYWMPDVFEQFFARFNRRPSDYYHLHRLDPSYRVVFGQDRTVDIPACRDQQDALFEHLEPGAARQLRHFLAQAEHKYRVGMGEYVQRPSLSPFEFFDARLIGESLRMDMTRSMRQHVADHFHDPRLIAIMEFPVLFLGGTAKDIPAMYSLMNYADLALGTWYPMGGMGMVAGAMVALAKELGVTFHTGEPATEIVIEHGLAKAVRTTAGTYAADTVIGAADYHHVEQTLVAPQWRSYSEAYWNSRVLSPSSLLFYLGVNKRLTHLLHHNLFFDEGLDQHADQIYHQPRWPDRPLFYVCCPSRTDPSVAPEGCENLFLLMPVAPGLEDTPEIRERYYHLLMDRLEQRTGQTIRDAVTVRRSYAHTDFISDYHSYKGNAYGLANLLRQTAFFKPRMQAKKVRNLYFAGQLTVPGPGVPPSLISGQVAAKVVSDGWHGIR